MPYLSCSTCGLTISESAARSPFQACPRCRLRHGRSETMRVVREPSRFARALDLDRVAKAKARLSGPARGAGSA
jgi:DNA-directed RNA polymerase subunit RPC12/RpoP